MYGELVFGSTVKYFSNQHFPFFISKILSKLIKEEMFVGNNYWGKSQDPFFLNKDIQIFHKDS